jgi:uncharacterized protein (DUF486 family)
MRTILLLTVSNIFMTFAWYGHLKYRNEALWKVILASWGIAFFEYCFQVPANRIGSYEFNAAQLKTIHHPDGFLGIFRAVSRRQIQVELRCRLRPRGHRIVFHFSQMVRAAIYFNSSGAHTTTS